MPEDRQYSKEFRDTISTLQKLDKYPLLVEALARTNTFKDFQGTLRDYRKEVE